MIDGWRPHDLAKFSETFADHWYNYNENWAANEKGTIPEIYFFFLLLFNISLKMTDKKREYFAYNCFHFNDRMSQENESILAFLLRKYHFEFWISVTVVHFFKCARASKFNATSSSPDNKKGSERCMISFFQLHTTISCLVVHLKLLNKAFIRFFQWSLPLGKGDPSAL